MINPSARHAIEEMVHRETHAWSSQNVHLLLSLFHPDMVWPWPPSPHDHDPLTWSMGFGRYNYSRWAKNWQQLFDDYTLARNNRSIERIEVSEEGDGGFAVVDIDTLWVHKTTGEHQLWRGRTCKVYTQLASGEWKFIMQTGVLDYT